MKLKIRNILNQITPKIIQGVRRSVFSLSIKDKIQYQIIPLQIPYPNIIGESESYNIILGSWFEIPNSSSLTSIVPFVWVSYNDIFNINNSNTPIESASAVRSRLDGISAGKRFLAPIRYWGPRSIWGATTDNIPSGSVPGVTNVTPWADTGIKGVTTEWNSWLDSLGTTFDFLIIDQENQYMISSFDGITFEKKLKGLTGDSRYTQAKYGLSSLSDLLSGITLTNVTLGAYSSGAEYITFNKVIGQYGAAVLNRALWDYSKQKLPDLRGSNYDGFIATINPGPDSNGHPQSHDDIFGTASAPHFYGILEGIKTAWYVNKSNPTQLIFRYTAPAGYTFSDLVPQTVWSGFIQSQQLARSVRRSDATKGFHPWIASPGYTGISVDAPVLFSTDDRYYYENIIHLGLLGAEAYLYWNPSQFNGLSLTYATKIDSTINELNTRFGNKRIKETAPSGLTSISWNTNYITTGAKLANNTYLWRTTFKPEISIAVDTSTNVQYILGSDVGVWKTTTNSTPPEYSYIDSLIFYDGSTGGITQIYDIRQMSGGGRAPVAAYEAMGAKYMPYVQNIDPYYLWYYDKIDGIPGLTTGWKGGLTANGSLRFGEGYNTNAFNYVTSREIDNIVRLLVLQGVTASKTEYIYINWFEDHRDVGHFGFGVMTGPTDSVDIISTTVDNNGITFQQPQALISQDNQGRTVRQNFTELAYTIAKIFDGGTGTDGVYFHGLRHYFPKCKFGVYNWPVWGYYFQDGSGNVLGNNVSVANIQSKIDFYADAWIKGMSGAIDSFDMWMPSFYSSLNSPDMNRIRVIQGVSACVKINELLSAAGKPKKLIIPFVSVFYNTIATGNPYSRQTYETEYYYTPPWTIQTDANINYEQLQPIMNGGGNGIAIWQNTATNRWIVAGRITNGQNEDTAPQPEWRKWMFNHPGGTTAGINQWSDKTMLRQAISAQYNYLKGVCLGATGNRWWWATASQNTFAGPVEQYTPSEWLPLGLSLAPYGNKVAYYNGTADRGATSSFETQQIIDYVLEDAKVRMIQTAKSLWSKNNT